MQSTATIILAVLALVSIGALIVAYALWRDRRRVEDVRDFVRGE